MPRAVSPRRAVFALLALVVGFVVIAPPPAGALSKSVILRLRAAARAQYPDAGDVMRRYSVMVYRGKAYATTRGTVKGVETVAVWEYVPDAWHCIFDYPKTESASPQVTQRYRAYGFTARQQNAVLAKPKPFPDS